MKKFIKIVLIAGLMIGLAAGCHLDGSGSSHKFKLPWTSNQEQKDDQVPDIPEITPPSAGQAENHVSAI